MLKFHTIFRNVLCNSISKEYSLIWSKYNRFNRLCNKTDVDEEKEREIERIKKNASLDEPPTACCQSGCANCVFIVWAESLTEKMENAGPEIADKILKMVDDPSMRAYLELELRIRGLKK